MTPGFKGTLWILLIIGLFAVMKKSHAGTEAELRQLLEGKTTVYQGTCALGAKSGYFEKDDKTPKVVHNCIVGVDMGEPGEIYYALIVDRRGRAVRLIKVDKDADKQEDIWTSRVSV